MKIISDLDRCKYLPSLPPK